MLEEMWPDHAISSADHAISSAITSTKSLLCCINLKKKKKNKKEKWVFLKIAVFCIRQMGKGWSTLNREC